MTLHHLSVAVFKKMTYYESFIPSQSSFSYLVGDWRRRKNFLSERNCCNDVKLTFSPFRI